MSWRCYPEWLAPKPGKPPVTCEETGETDKGAERHTQTTGHPTVSGPNAAKRGTK